jgi:mono/diheme cytochrome c family protein
MAGTAVQQRVNLALLVSAFLTVGLLLVAVLEEWEEEKLWHSGHGGGSSAMIADITIDLGGSPYQEHCQTCHPAGGSTAASNVPGPSRAHPDIGPHSMYDLGCTGCHLGEGMAADTQISHGRVGGGVRRVLMGEDLQARCYVCHELKPLKGAEKAWQGSVLFSETACDTCHTTGVFKGASYGPDLSDVGSSLGLEQIRRVIENPRAELASSIMPKFSLSPEETKAISYFLKSRVKNPYYQTPMMRMAGQREQESAESTARRPKVGTGKELLKETKCLACHKFGEIDGQIGPDLSYMAYMRSAEYVRTFLRSPYREIPGAVMPRVPMDPSEEAALVATLQRTESGRFHGDVSSKNVYMMLCQRCHAARGDGFGIIQPNLADFPRAFHGNAAFFRSIPDERIVKSLEEGVPGTSMPPYGKLLGRAKINAVIDLLFQAFIHTGRMDKELKIPPAKPARLPPLTEGLETYRKECFRCHGVEGRGRGPEYLRYLPRPRNLTNRKYFSSLTDDRIAASISFGVPGTAMPAFAAEITPESVWALVAVVREFSKVHRDEY